MGVTIKSGQAYITATPSSQNSQVLRARASTDYTAYTINANASGSTKYDWIYLSVSAVNANTPSADGSNVASFVTSRSSSNVTDNGTPPTYGLLLAVVTVANGASSITNSNITDKRFNTSIGAQNGSLVVSQSGTGVDAIIQAAGIDASVSLDIKPKGSTGAVNVYDGLGNVVFGFNRAWQTWSPTYANITVGNGTVVSKYVQIGKTIKFKWKLTWGSTTAFNASPPTISLPVTSTSDYDSATGDIGKVRAYDVSATTAYVGFTLWITTGSVKMLGLDASNAAYEFSSAAPFAWTTGDILFVSGEYEAA